MLDLGLFRRPTFVGASVAAFVLSASMFAMFLYLTLYVQNILGYSALESGLRFMPVTIVSFLAAPVSGKLADRLGVRWFIAGGLALVGAGLWLMDGLEPGDDWTALLAGFLVAGGGIGVVNPALATAAIGVVEPRQAGMASGINSTFRQVGIATGIAAWGAIFQHTVRDEFVEARRPRTGGRGRLHRLRRRPPRRGPAARAARGAGVRHRAQPPARAGGDPRVRGRRPLRGADPPGRAARRGRRARRLLGLMLGRVAAAAATVYDAAVRGGARGPAADAVRPDRPRPQRNLYRYLPVRPPRRRTAPPVLLVPPLAAPAICFDLRRGCSLAEHLLQQGREAYLLDYGEIEFGNRNLGLEHWIEDVIPGAVRAASEDAGGRPVRIVGWCLGGIMALLAHAADRDLPIDSMALVASPWDFSRVPMIAPLRPIAAVTRGRGITQLYRAMGGAPAPLVRGGYQLAGHRQVRDEAVDDRHQPRRPRPARADRGGRRVHGPDARLPRADLRSAVPPLLPHQRPRAGAAGADRPAPSTWPTRGSRCWPSRAAATGSRRSRRATTSPSSCPTRGRWSSRPRREATSAC